MSANNDQQNLPTNNVRGPTSALTSFLRELGIRVENRNRRAAREARQRRQEESRNDREGTEENATENEQEATQEQSNNSAASSSAADAATSSTETVGILYTPYRTRAAAQRASAATAKASSGKTGSSSKKRKAKGDKDDDDDDDEDDEDDWDLRPGPSRRAQPGRTRVLFCQKCKSRFARPANSTPDVELDSVCPRCLAGKNPKPKRKSPAKKRRMLQSSSDYLQVPSLQDICIEIVAQYIDDVEALGEISFSSMDKVAKIICRNRKLTNQTARLFMEPRVINLNLYDCTNVDENGLMNVAHFCPDLQTLRLVYCGRITSKVIDFYGERLHRLRSVEFSGPFLVTKEAWIGFFRNIGSRLETFKITDTARFDKDCLEELVKCCPNFKHLRLKHLSKLTDDWLEIIARLRKLKSLELEYPDAKQQQPTSQSTIDMLSKIGNNLKVFAMRGCSLLDDDTLLKGLLPYCPQLSSLSLTQCELITSEGVQKLFKGWKEKEKSGLDCLDLSRCLQVDDEALKEIVRHSHKTLKYINLHSLDNITANGLEVLAGAGEGFEGIGCTSLHQANFGFVRAMDNFVLKELIDNCPHLQEIRVHGCYQLTDDVRPRGNLRIIGREILS